MLKILRKKGVAKKILWFTAIIIVLSFGVFGTANYLTFSNTASHAGKIFGKAISMEDFQKNYLFTRNQAILQYGDNFNKISSFLRLESETWDRIILLQEARRQRIKVSDQEVIETIAAFPFFQREGQFDPLLYNDLLRYAFKCTPRQFEEGIRGSIMFNKLLEKQLPPLTLSDDQLWEAYKKQNEKIQVSYVLIAPETYKNEISVEDQEAEAYFNNHKEDFQVPLSINVEYLNIQSPQNATPEQKKELDQKIESITQELKIAPDLNAIAQKYNLAVEETGLFSQEQPSLKIGSFELLKKAFTLNINEISEALITANGYTFFKVKEKRIAHIPEFPAAADKVKDTLKLQKALDVAKTKTNEYLELFKQEKTNNPNKSFSDLAQSANLTVEQTPPFNHGQYVPNIGVAKEFQQAAFSLNENNKLVGPVPTPKGYCILHLDSLTPATNEEFAKEKEIFRESMLEEMKSGVYNDYVSRLRMQANLEDNMSKLEL